MPIERAQLDAALKGVQESRVSYQDALKLLNGSRNLDEEIEKILQKESVTHVEYSYRFKHGLLCIPETSKDQVERIAKRICEQCVPGLEDGDKKTVEKFIRDNITKEYKAYTATKKNVEEGVTARGAFIDTALMPLKVGLTLPILAIRIVVAAVQDVTASLSSHKHTFTSRLGEVLHPRNLYDLALDLASGPRSIAALVKAKLASKSLRRAVRASIAAGLHTGKNPVQRSAAR